MKKCSQCELNKELSSFPYRNKKEKILHAWCKECLYGNQKKRWKDRKRKAISLMGGCCCKCGYKKDMAALQFHHLEPKEKKFVWEKMRKMRWSSVIKELKKCILVCANCHAELHSSESNSDFSIENLADNNMLNRKITPTGKCENCNKEVYGTKFCSSSCIQIQSRKVKNRPTKASLKKMINTMTWVAIGKKYGVSDNAVRKWAKKYAII
tara:strand:+ start:281 stop:910 length:630 start_codon:yes stop_codon:yes gene_type:complete